jgi:antitoxin component of RelBE/YafQ-DinJ toxin-antitoxin module
MPPSQPRQPKRRPLPEPFLNVSFQVGTDLFIQFIQVCEREGMSRSEALRILAQQAVERGAIRLPAKPSQPAAIA